LNKAEKTKTKT